MIWYIFYKPNGEILQCGNCGDSELLLQLPPEGALVTQVNELVNPSTCYFRTADGAVVPYPARPSKYHTFNYTSKVWEDQRTLQELKDQKWADIKAEREQANAAGFTWSGHIFDSDPAAVTKISGAVQMASILGSAYSVDWTLADNSTITLNAGEMVQVGLALGMHINSNHEHARNLRATIEAATTKAAVEAITW